MEDPKQPEGWFRPSTGPLYPYLSILFPSGRKKSQRLGALGFDNAFHHFPLWESGVFLGRKRGCRNRMVCDSLGRFVTERNLHKVKGSGLPSAFAL